jgi:hypothetical protein
MANVVRDPDQTRYDLTDYIAHYYDQLWIERTARGFYKTSLYYKMVPPRSVRAAPKRMRDAFR